MRWPVWSPRGLALLAWPAVLLWALAAERAAYIGADVGHWLPDLVTGLVVAAAGSYAVWCGGTRCGVLLLLCGVVWFVPNFAAVGGPLGALAGQVLFLYRGPLVHLLLAFPTGRLASRTELLVAAAGYLIALDPRVWGSPAGTVVASVVLVFVVADSVRRVPGRYRPARVLAAQVAAALAAAMLGTVFVRNLGGEAAMAYPTLIGFEVVFTGAALVLAAALGAKTWERAVVTDLLLEDRHGGSLRDALAWALADESLRIWFGAPGPTQETRGSELTVVERAGEPLATIAHRPGLLGDTNVREAVVAAVRLGAENLRLHRELEASVAEVRASRRRLLRVADDEAVRLERRLSTGPLRRLAELDGLLPDQALSDALATAMTDLRELAQGLHPRALAERGLVSAVGELARRCPVPVEVHATPVCLAADAEATAYFVCSEALANVVKHARADSVRVSFWSANGRTFIEVSDDGAGGADVDAGSGLRGLVDRLEALGGALDVDSSPGGTRVRAVIPS